jgi:hypothetical protein
MRSVSGGGFRSSGGGFHVGVEDEDVESSLIFFCDRLSAAPIIQKLSNRLHLEENQDFRTTLMFL